MVPPFWRKIVQEKASTNDKLEMAHTLLIENMNWQELQVSPLNPLLTMFVTQKFKRRQLSIH